MEWEKILAYLIKGYYPKYIKNSYNSIAKKPNNLIRKWAEELNRYFSKEDIQMTNRHMKRGSTSFIIREMQIKTHWDSTSHLSEWLSSKRPQILCWQGCGAFEMLIHI